MSTPEVITANARSMAAKKRWERQKSKEEVKKVNWFSAHKDLVYVIATIVTGVAVMLTSLHRLDNKLSENINKTHWELSQEIHKVRSDLSNEISNVRNELSGEISSLKNEVVKIQTVMIIKGIVPTEVFAATEEK
jgi:hypothetical protein